MALLEVAGIGKSFGSTAVLRDISFDLQKGEALAIIGSSGSGKTTLLRCLNFLETADTGSITVAGETLWSADDARTQSEAVLRKKRLHFGLVFQNFNLFPQYTALQNVMLAGELLAKERPDYKQNRKQIHDELEAHARELLAQPAVDGGLIDNILVDGVRSINTGNVIFLRIGDRWGKGKQPSMKNVTIQNVYAEVPLRKPDAGYNYEGPIEDMPRNISPASIVGLPDYPIENITLKNITMVYPGGGNKLFAYRGLTPAELDGIPEMRDTYPEFSQFKELPAWGFYIRHAKGITFDNVKFIAEKPGDYRPGLVTDDVQGLTLRKVEFEEPGANGKEQVFTYKTTGIVKE